MFFRKVKLRLKSKYAKLFMIIFFVSIIVIWLSFKGQLIYENVKYIGNYYDYYVEKYLHGNYNYLYLYGYSSIYIEEAFKYIF